MNSKQALHLCMMAAMSMNLHDDILNKHTATVKAKLCLTCGIEHIHHNDFCSRECCFNYKGKGSVMVHVKLGGSLRISITKIEPNIIEGTNGR